jgi:hypothetical protein
VGGAHHLNARISFLEFKLALGNKLGKLNEKYSKAVGGTTHPGCSFWLVTVSKLFAPVHCTQSRYSEYGKCEITQV